VKLDISPNPFFQSATIRIANGSQKGNIFSLYDLNGRELKRYQFSGDSFQLERADLPEGLYFFEVSADQQIIGNGKLVIGAPK